MTALTVCVPAYDVGSVVDETLASLQAQSFTDFRVEIAVEPPGTDTLAAVAPFLSDPRIELHVNARRLGWAGNVRAQLQRVDTPYFVILPHDDWLDPEYLRLLMSTIEARPSASVAYGDMIVFGAAPPFRKLLDLPDGSVRQQLMAFFLGGAEAVPWRGVTRASRIASTGGFPVDDHQGFAVECEWALSLLLQGPAVHVPQAIYHKRIHAPDVVSASRARRRDVDAAGLVAGYEAHRSRMLALLAGGAENDPLLVLAAEAAMSRRFIKSLGQPFTPAALQRAQDALSTLAGSRTNEAAAIRSVIQLAMAHHFRLSKDRSSAEALTTEAVRSNPINVEALIYLARLRLKQDRSDEALALAREAGRLEPQFSGLQSLTAAAERTAADALKCPAL